MLFKAPYEELQSELYKLLTNADENCFDVFDSAAPIEEVLASYKTLSDVKYVIITDIAFSPTVTKDGRIRWKTNVTLDLFSTYRGKKQLAEMANALGIMLTNYENAFDANMRSKHNYAVHKMWVNSTSIGPCTTTSEGLNWQHGTMVAVMDIEQLL